MIEDHRTHFEQPREEGGHAPELVLAPVLVGMVMALSAVKAPSEEDADLLGHHIRRRADLVVGKEMTRGGPVPLRGETLARDFVIRAICFDALANPFPIFLAPLGRQAVGEDGNPEDVRETKSPVVDKLG